MNLQPFVSQRDMTLSRKWVGGFLADTFTIPISFRYGDEFIQGIPAGWQRSSMRRRIDANIIETMATAVDPMTGLKISCECLEYLDYPVIEWTAWFSNEGKDLTPILSDIQALDADFHGKIPNLRHCNGDFYSEKGYTTELTSLPEGAELSFSPTGGRPCDGAFPYYRIVFEGCGMSLAVGWPAQWRAVFRGLADGVHITAGQEKTFLRLKPGERIRTPRITILSWEGDEARAINLWRRWYRTHVLPRSHGQPLKPKLAVCAPEEGEEFTASTEENQLRDMAKFKQYGFPFDVWWIDAGWYPCYNENHERKWWRTGTWEPDPERYPNGLKPVSDFAEKNGANLLVWFEPERVFPGSKLDRERTEFLLRAKENENALLFLGNPAARQWLTDHICWLIQENGIKIYRQDFNFEPLAHWRENDTPDRQGMNENLHVQGYLQYWDDLLKRNPGLWIDSCSSGGRRNDLETMRRSVPLHYTDYGYGDHPVKLDFHRTLYEWIPYFKEATLSWDLHGVARFDHVLDSYSFHCGMAAMMFVTLDIRRDDYDIPLGLRMIEIWRKAADILLWGDYYALTPAHRDAGKWVAWQFNRPEMGDGFIQGFRLPKSKEDILTVCLNGLDAGATYELKNPETGDCMEAPGDDLMRYGFTFALPKRSATIWFYRKKA